MVCGNDGKGALGWTQDLHPSRITAAVCRDPGCGQLSHRMAGITELSAVPDRLALGTHYWRVRAVSGSGLDGYPSEPRTLHVRSLWRKPHPARRQ